MNEEICNSRFAIGDLATFQSRNPRRRHDCWKFVGPLEQSGYPLRIQQSRLNYHRVEICSLFPKIANRKSQI